MNEAIGNRLKQVRIALGLTQSQMAEIIGIKQGTYSPYEKNGNIPMDKLELLKYKKHLNIDWVLFGSGKMFESSNIENQFNKIYGIGANVTGSGNRVGNMSGSDSSEVVRIIAENEELKKEISRLKDELLKSKERIIELMSKQ